MNLLLCLLIAISFADDHPTAVSAPRYNSIMDPANSTMTPTTSGVSGHETPTIDAVSTADSSTMRRKVIRKTLEESCKKIKGRMVCNQPIKKNISKEKAIDIPESDLE